MKKTTLSQLMNLGDVQKLSSNRLHELKGGCGDGIDGIWFKKHKSDDDKEDGDDGCNSGSNDFIPPPGI